MRTSGQESHPDFDLAVDGGCYVSDLSLSRRSVSGGAPYVNRCGLVVPAVERSARSVPQIAVYVQPAGVQATFDRDPDRTLLRVSDLRGIDGRVRILCSDLAHSDDLASTRGWNRLVYSPLSRKEHN